MTWAERRPTVGLSRMTEYTKAGAQKAIVKVTDSYVFDFIVIGFLIFGTVLNTSLTGVAWVFRN
jgi:hypothetical protein